MTCLIPFSMLLTTSVTVFTSNLACLNQLTAAGERLSVVLVSAIVSRVRMRPRLSRAADQSEVSTELPTNHSSPGLATMTHCATHASSSRTRCSIGVTNTVS